MKAAHGPRAVIGAATGMERMVRKKRQYQTKPVGIDVVACCKGTYEKMPPKKRSQLEAKRTQRENTPLPNEADGNWDNQWPLKDLWKNARQKTNPIQSRLESCVQICRLASNWQLEIGNPFHSTFDNPLVPPCPHFGVSVFCVSAFSQVPRNDTTQKKRTCKTKPFETGA